MKVAQRLPLLNQAYEPEHTSLPSRPLLLLERTMYREGQTPFTCVFTIKIVGELPEENLEPALLALQAKHALLRSAVLDVDDRPHFVLQNDAVPISLRIVERSSEDDWQREVRQEWTVPFAASREPLVRFVWVRGTSAHEMILVAHHCICDGQSGITLLQEFLNLCEDPNRASEETDPLKKMEDLVPASVRQDRRFQQRVRWKMRLLRLGLALKRRDGARTPAAIAEKQMYFRREQLDARTSTSIAARCKSEGVTIVAAAAVACVQAFREVRGGGTVRKAYAMVNARRFLSQLHQDSLFGIAPGVELNLKVMLNCDEAQTGFWESARAIKAGMTQRIDRLGMGLYEYLVGLENLHDQYDRLVGRTEGISAIRHITLSNMGRLDLPTQYRTFRVEKVYSPLVMVSPTPANTVVISSFAGQFEFAIVSDIQSLPESQADTILQRALGTLCICSGVGDTPAAAIAPPLAGGRIQ